MATRLYFTDSIPGFSLVAASATDWEHIQTNSPSLLATAPDSSTLFTFAYNPDTADHIASADSMHYQFVTQPLIAQTISGNFKAQFQCLQTFNNDNLQLTMKLYVVSNDGLTTKETLRAITRNSTELVTTLANRKYADIALTAATLEDGDRIVIEIGLGGTITTGAGGTIGHNGSIRFGNTASSGDLPEDDTTTGTTFRPWAEFSRTLLFQGSPLLAATQTDFPQTRSRYKGDDRREGWADSFSWISQALVPFDTSLIGAAIAQAAEGFRMEDRPWLVDAGRIKGNIRRRGTSPSRSRLTIGSAYAAAQQSLESFRSVAHRYLDVRTQLDIPSQDWITEVVPPPPFDPELGGWAAMAGQIRLSDNQEFLWWSKDR